MASNVESIVLSFITVENITVVLNAFVKVLRLQLNVISELIHVAFPTIPITSIVDMLNTVMNTIVQLLPIVASSLYNLIQSTVFEGMVASAFTTFFSFVDEVVTSLTKHVSSFISNEVFSRLEKIQNNKIQDSSSSSRPTSSVIDSMIPILVNHITSLTSIDSSSCLVNEDKQENLPTLNKININSLTQEALTSFLHVVQPYI
jgi:hypothetical protein